MTPLKMQDYLVTFLISFVCSSLDYKIFMFKVKIALNRQRNKESFLCNQTFFFKGGGVTCP